MKFIKYFLISMFLMLSLCGFALKSKPKSFILFSSYPFLNNDTVCKNSFAQGEKVYYEINLPNGFEDDFVRIRVLKKNNKVDFAGYSVKYTEDVEVEKGEKIYSSDFSIYEAGMYIMQVTEFSNPSKPVAVGLFKIE